MYINIIPYNNTEITLARNNIPEPNKILIRIYYRNRFSLFSHPWKRMDIDDVPISRIPFILSYNMHTFKNYLKWYVGLKWYHIIENVKIRHTIEHNPTIAITNNVHIENMYLETWYSIDDMIPNKEMVYKMKQIGDCFMGFSYQYYFKDIKFINWLKLTNKISELPKDTVLIVPRHHIDKIKYLQ